MFVFAHVDTQGQNRAQSYEKVCLTVISSFMMHGRKLALGGGRTVSHSSGNHQTMWCTQLTQPPATEILIAHWWLPLFDYFSCWPCDGGLEDLLPVGNWLIMQQQRSARNSCGVRLGLPDGQKSPRTAEILNVYFYDCTGLSEVITFECLTRFDSLFLMTLFDLYLDIFYWIRAPSCPQPELEQNRLSDMSFALGVHGQRQVRTI
jgi:hypothetical protein